MHFTVRLSLDMVKNRCQYRKAAIISTPYSQRLFSAKALKCPIPFLGGIVSKFPQNLLRTGLIFFSRKIVLHKALKSLWNIFRFTKVLQLNVLPATLDNDIIEICEVLYTKLLCCATIDSKKLNKLFNFLKLIKKRELNQHFYIKENIRNGNI